MGTGPDTSYEFDVIDFLSVEFDHISIGRPQLDHSVDLWKATYIVSFGVNEIARFYEDFVELEIENSDTELRFNLRTCNPNLVGAYTEVLDLFGRSELEAILNREGLPTYGDGQVIDHDINIDIIDVLLTGVENRDPMDSEGVDVGVLNPLMDNSEPWDASPEDLLEIDRIHAKTLIEQNETDLDKIEFGRLRE